MRSKIEDFQKFAAAEESLEMIKTMSLNDDNKVSEEQMAEATRRAEAQEQMIKNKAEAAELKDKGNQNVKLKQYESAIKMYTRAIELYDSDPVFFSNRSQCYLNLEKYKECIDDASKAIALDPKSSKSFYRQMVAYEKLGDDFRALKSCRQWLDLSPEDMTCKNSYDRIHNRIMEAEKKKDKEKIRWSRLGSKSKVVDFVTKPPHLTSKRPMKKVPLRLRKAHSPIPESVIDRIFDNNTGENVLEPETDSKLFKPNFLLSPSEPAPKIPKLIEMAPEKLKQEIVQPKPVIVEDKKKIDKENENLKAAESHKELKLDEIESLYPVVPDIPSTGPQFFAIWKEMLEAQRFMFLKKIASNNVAIGKLLGAQLTSEMLSEIINIIHKYFSTFMIPYISLLNELGKNIEIGLLAMFLEHDEKTSEINKFYF